MALTAAATVAVAVQHMRMSGSSPEIAAQTDCAFCIQSNPHKSCESNDKSWSCEVLGSICECTMMKVAMYDAAVRGLATQCCYV